MQGFRKKLRTTLTIFGLLLISLLAYSINLREREATGLFERVVLHLSAPFQKGIDRVLEGGARVWDRYVWLVATEKENALLQEENLRLRSELSSLQEVALANERLRRLLEFKETGLEAFPARVIAEDASSWFRTIVIDKGSRDGLAEGMAVVVPEGVVGRIIKIASTESRVLLITDASSAASSLVQRTRSRGVCRGRGDSLTFDFVLRQEDIQVGDRVVTSGMGGVFPKGLLIGEVTRVEGDDYGFFQTVEVAPAADFSRLEEVLVLKRKEP